MCCNHGIPYAKSVVHTINFPNPLLSKPEDDPQLVETRCSNVTYSYYYNTCVFSNQLCYYSALILLCLTDPLVYILIHTQRDGTLQS
jgi:hypothetical protein